MSSDPIAYPRPAPLEERIKRRGCRNCLFYNQQAGECRQRSPFNKVQSTDWCGEWRAHWQPRVGWESAFAPIELEGEPREPEVGKNPR